MGLPCCVAPPFPALPAPALHPLPARARAGTAPCTAGSVPCPAESCRAGHRTWRVLWSAVRRSRIGALRRLPNSESATVCRISTSVRPSLLCSVRLSSSTACVQAERVRL